MNQTVRTNVLTIPNKLKCDVRLFVSDRGNPEYKSRLEGQINTILSMFPSVMLTIIRAPEFDEDGKRIRAVMNPDDSLAVNKYHFPILVTELKGMCDDLKTPELYQYHGKRLEINELAAEKIRRVFMIGRTTVELSAIVVVVTNQLGEDERREGVKLKFNNEQSSVCLTVNEITSLAYTLDHLDLDTVALMLYTGFIDRTQINSPNTLTEYTRSPEPVVDIQPKSE